MRKLIFTNIQSIPIYEFNCTGTYKVKTCAFKMRERIICFIYPFTQFWNFLTTLCSTYAIYFAASDILHFQWSCLNYTCFLFSFFFFKRKILKNLRPLKYTLVSRKLLSKQTFDLYMYSWLVKKFFILSLTTLRNNMSELRKFKQKLRLPSGIERKNRRACIVSWLQMNSTLSRKVSNLCLIKGLYLIRSNVLASFKHVKVYHLFSKYL